MRSSLCFPPSDSAHFSRSFGASRVTSDTGAPRRRCIIDAEVRMHGSGLELALVFLLAAVIAVPVFKKLGLGAVLAYLRSEEHTSALQSLMRLSYAVFCLKKNNKTN